MFSLTLNIYSVQNSCLQCDLCADTPLRSQVRFLKGVPPTLASDLGISGPDAESAKGKSISLFSVTAVRFPLGETLDLHRSSGASVASSRLWCTGIKLPGCTGIQVWVLMVFSLMNKDLMVLKIIHQPVLICVLMCED